MAAVKNYMDILSDMIKNSPKSTALNETFGIAKIKKSTEKILKEVDEEEWVNK